MKDEEIISAITNIVGDLRNKDNGLNSLSAYIVQGLIQEAKPNTLHDFVLKCVAEIKEKGTLDPTDEEQFNNIKNHIFKFVIRKIHENEENEKKSPEEFKKDILNTIIQHLIAYDDPNKDKEGNIFGQNLSGFNDMRESLNGKPEVFKKYGISTSCANAASAFVFEFKKKYENSEIPKTCFLVTTRWSNLIDGRVGHVVPCVKLNNNDWVMVEPLHENSDNKEYKIISNEDFKEGKSLEHLIDDHKRDPFMIVKITTELPDNHKDFLEKYSRVFFVDDAKAFLEQVSNEEYWSDTILKKIKSELSILSKLSEEEKQLDREKLQDKIKNERKKIEEQEKSIAMRIKTQEAHRDLDQNLKEVHAEFHKIFKNAIGPTNLNDYAASIGMSMEQAEDWKFALTANDIIEKQIPAKVVGCSGRAAVFSYLLRKKMVPHKIILTAVVKDLNRARNDVQQGDKPNLINGHQIIAVEIDGQLRMFDPGNKTLELIDGDVFVGRNFKYDFSDNNYVITNIMSFDEYEEIDSLAKLQSAYMQVWNFSPTNQKDDR